MQIAALNPRFWDKSQVGQDVLDEEKKIMMVQMENEDPKMAGKPEAVHEKIVMGKLNKFYVENCSLQQEFVKDNSMTVEKYNIASCRQGAGRQRRLLGDAVRFEKGEGIEKKQENFAEEIALWQRLSLSYRIPDRSGAKAPAPFPSFDACRVCGVQAF